MTYALQKGRWCGQELGHFPSNLKQLAEGAGEATAIDFVQAFSARPAP